jgi:hypothetical protein
MATVEEGLQAQIRNIEATYAKPMSEWQAIITASGMTKHTDIVTMLKSDYGMTHGAAHRVSIVARQAAQPTGTEHDSDPISAMYTGRKAGLRPLHDVLMNAIEALGDDIELAPKKGYVSPAAPQAVRDDPAQRRRPDRHRAHPPGSARTRASNPPPDSTPCSPTESA